MVDPIPLAPARFSQPRCLSFPGKATRHSNSAPEISPWSCAGSHDELGCLSWDMLPADVLSNDPGTNIPAPPNLEAPPGTAIGGYSGGLFLQGKTRPLKPGLNFNLHKILSLTASGSSRLLVTWCSPDFGQF